ncbi:MAG: hypothetical protein AB7R55_04170 [Gemmatimonadales bacterium]
MAVQSLALHGRPALFAIGLLLLQPVAAAAQSRPADPFDHLAGAWQGDGTLFGRRATFRMEWAIKPGGFAVLSFSNGALDAAAVYRRAGDSSGAWLDTRGQQLSISWTVGDSSLISIWSGSETGRTVYRWIGRNEVEVVDSVQAGGGWREFGRARYRRVVP